MCQAFVFSRVCTLFVSSPRFVSQEQGLALFFLRQGFLGHTLRYRCKGDSYPLSSHLLIGLLF